MTNTNKNSPLQYPHTINQKETKRPSIYLSLTITDNLRWDKHTENICGSTPCKHTFLKRRLWNATPNVKLAAYQTVARPALEHASIIWDPHSQTELAN